MPKAILVGTGSQPVFLYSWSPAVAFGKKGQDLISHCSENPSIYLQQGGPDYAGPELTQAVGQYWYSFAKHGDPSVARAAGAPPWAPYSNASDALMVFDDPIRMERAPRKTPCEFCATTPLCEG